MHPHPSELRNSAHKVMCCYGTTMLQSINSCINALLQGKLRSSMLQIFCTNGCILIGQIQLLALRFMGQGIGYYVQRSLLVQYGDGQLIHPFKPTCLMSTKVWLHKYMLPRFVVGIYRSRYTINVTSPLDTRLVNCQQLFLAPTIVAFRRSVLATMVCNGVQTIIILLQQYCTSCILTRISINHKWPLKVRQFQYRRVAQ